MTNEKPEQSVNVKRGFITTSNVTFDVDEVKKDRETIVKTFDEYLDYYPTKSGKSKHDIMGPVAKILERAKTRKWRAGAIKGYALRIHEMNPKSGFVSKDAADKLSQGIDALMELCEKTPTTLLNRLLEQIDYEIYFNRRKKTIEYLEETRKRFIEFLKRQYSTGDTLATAWNEPGLTFEDVYYPSKNPKKANEQKKANIAAFWKLPEAEKLIPIEEEE